MNTCNLSPVGALRGHEDYHEVGERIRADYEELAPKYRGDDEIEVTSANHRRLESTLGLISSSFRRPIRALEVGCGTGRYFHCLQNVEKLVGMDISQEMLRSAKKPVLENQITAKSVELICANAYFASFPEGSFDFIYCLGMFGHGCPVTADICNKFFSWLAPGGKLFFNTVDVAGMRWDRRIRKSIRQTIYPFLPSPLRHRLDDRERRMPFFGLNKRELERTMRATRFAEFHVSSHTCQSPLWHGRHIECLAEKAG